MSAISLRLPDSLHNRIRILSKSDHISINQFVATAVAEKISSLDTETYLSNRAQRASRKSFERAMSMIPDVEPEPYDKIRESNKKNAAYS